MKTPEQASALANALVNGAKSAGRKSGALVTSMDMPLGFAVGNALEVKESIDVLQGNGRIPSDIVELSVELAARMVSIAKEMPLDKSRELCRENLKNGKAYEVFAEMVRLHGGDLERFLDEWDSSVECVELAAQKDGYISDIDAEAVARAAFNLGAGRAKTADSIDNAAGVLLGVAYGDRVSKGQILARLLTSSRSSVLRSEAEKLEKAFAVKEEPPVSRRLILEEF
jgi:pyrimidine-nucleoside phosphorylase